MNVQTKNLTNGIKMILYYEKQQEIIKSKLRKPMLTCNDNFYKMWESKYKKYVKDCYAENQIQKLYDSN